MRPQYQVGWHCSWCLPFTFMDEKFLHLLEVGNTEEWLTVQWWKRMRVGEIDFNGAPLSDTVAHQPDDGTPLWAPNYARNTPHLRYLVDRFVSPSILIHFFRNTDPPVKEEQNKM